MTKGMIFDVWKEGKETFRAMSLGNNLVLNLETLEKVWQEGKFDSKITLLNTTDGDSCGIDGCN